MMLNETYTKNIQPRDPERIRSDIETPCATVYNQGVTPVLYDNAVQASSRPGRAVEYLPENTIALSRFRVRDDVPHPARSGFGTYHGCRLELLPELRHQ